MPISIIKLNEYKKDYTSVRTVLERNNLLSEYKKLNMIVFVQEDSHYYKLTNLSPDVWFDLGLTAEETTPQDYIIFNTLSDRNNLLQNLRKYGQLVFVKENNRYYKLLSGLTNNDWEDLGDSLSQKIKNYIIVSTLSNRNLISEGQRTHEMIVFVQENSRYYTLLGGLTNSNWSDLGYTLTQNVRDYTVVETLIERNNIPTTQRKQGLIVSVKQNNRTYRLSKNLKNSDWEDLGNMSVGFDTNDSLSNIQGAYQLDMIRNNHDYENNWTLRTSFSDISFYSICWSPELKIFVAVGSGIATSNDGINWTKRTFPTNPFSPAWNSVCWSPELMIFVAISNSGINDRVMTSPDGINWTRRVSAANNNWTSITWSPELMLFVAVADSGTNDRVMTSSNGINWNIITSPNNDWKSICWSSQLGVFVAVASSGTNNRVMTSPNGINWNNRTSAADNFWWSVTWSTELSIFVAVGLTGSGNRVMTSPDGINWTIRTGITNNGWYSVTWSPELMLFVAVSNDGVDNRVMTSPNGINWTTRTGIPNRLWYSICWSPELGIFVAGGGDSGTASDRVMTSLSDTRITQYRPRYNKIFGYNNFNHSWITRSSPADNNWSSITWSPELRIFVAVANSGADNRVMTSRDGINWIIRTSAANNSWNSICWSPELGIFVAVASSGTNDRVMTSPDGINWTSRTSAANNSWNSICWSPELGIFVAVASSGTNNRIMTSPNGINWTIRTSPADNNWTSVCWNPKLGIFLVVSSFTINVMTSSDGINWTLVNFNWTTDLGSFSPNYNCIIWSIELKIFVAVGGSIATSLDGINWIIRNNSPINNYWTSICWSPELMLFVAVSNEGNNNRIMTSSDAITWTIRTSPADNNWRSVIWSPELGFFVAVANSGTSNRIMTNAFSTAINKPYKIKKYY